MHIINDFFLLVWNEKQDQQAVFNEKQPVEFSDDFTQNLEQFCDSATILLIINPQNLSQIATLEESTKLFGGLFKSLEIDKVNVQKAQRTILTYLIKIGNLDINRAISKRFETLRKEEIISYDISRRLISLMSLIEEKKSKTITLHVKKARREENFYKTAKSTLLTAIENLKQSVESSTLVTKLEQIPSKLENQSFSIGITGVMNAGKSTMLNALLGNEVLGTSVIPETANLTLIKYAKEPYAVVNFWNAKEWKRIEEGASSLKGMDAFVKETKNHFSKNFETFINDDGKSEKIKVEDLSLYTSAKYSDKKCNLVKSVELYTDLKFVQEGVQIVDTPGLDDPVIQREEITLDYLSQCDLLIHLMNASQAATQKDVDFIIDALIYRNVVQLLIVITRIDMVKEKELQEVIAYTKASIEARLKAQNKASKLDEIIAKIAFVPIAGKLALMHKMGKAAEALALGYDMERTGLPFVENYLSEVLFGEDSQKAKLIISSNQKEIEHIALQAKQSFENELRFLSISTEELAQEVTQHEEEKKALSAFLIVIKNALLQSEEDIQHYFKTLEKFATHKMGALHVELKRRVFDDVTYEVSKNKQLPKEDRIGYMLEMGIKDGLVDLMRDYRYEFQKKMQSVLVYMETKYVEFKVEGTQNSFDVAEFFEKHLKGLLVFKNSSILIQQVNEAIHKYGKSSLSELSFALDALLGEEFSTLKEMLQPKLECVNHELLDSFIRLSSMPANEIEEAMNAKEEMLEKALQCINDQSLDKQSRINMIGEKLRVIDIVLKDLSVSGASK
ncbi:MAG: dynamin family protein [Campylobacteraceae bacterium]|nr:dynamin family protein [Campylobacteraceae bacterium]